MWPSPSVDCWTVIGGIAQIAAALFAIVTILQARKMIGQADAQIRLAADPEWHLVRMGAPGMLDGGPTGVLGFENAGLGVATVPSYELVADDGTTLASGHFYDEFPGVTIGPGAEIEVPVARAVAEASPALLRIWCTNRLGQVVVTTFPIDTGGNAYCSNYWWVGLGHRETNPNPQRATPRVFAELVKLLGRLGPWLEGVLQWLEMPFASDAPD